jgi:putative sterol carrier protein
MTLLKTNFIGPERPVVRDPEAIRVYFETIGRQADPRHLPAGTTVQWDFTDSDPWYLVVDNGATRTEQGRASSPDLTLRCGLDDWADLSANRVDPRKLLLSRRIRPRGKLRVLMKLPKVFG